MAQAKEIRKLVRECRQEILTLRDFNLNALIYLVSELLLDPNRELPFEITEISETTRKIALESLAIYKDWQTADATILGVLYESLLDTVEGDDSKQGRRRKSGIFYTPAHITEFLVRSALDACSDSLKKEPPRVIDPACGGGAFLIAAFRELRKRYPSVSPSELATKCIHGVDTDPDAVHVARLSMWIEAGLSQVAWKKLETNIRVGDSLRDFLSDDCDRFDIVVGNPPWRNVKRGIPEGIREFCKANYRTAKGQWDLAAPFVELALCHLLTDGGSCGLILPNPILLAENYLPVRQIVLENRPVAFGPAGSPFLDPNVEASLLVVRSGAAYNNLDVTVVDGRSGRIEQINKLPVELLDKLPSKVFSHRADHVFLGEILQKLDKGDLVPLGELVRFTRGIECGKRDDRIVRSGKSGPPLLVGEDLKPFSAQAEHRFKVSQEDRACGILKKDELWQGERLLLLRRVGDRPIAAVAEPPVFVLNTIYVVRGEGIDAHSACALLNSGMFRKLLTQLFAFDDAIFPYLRISQVSRIPVPVDILRDVELGDLSRELHALLENEKSPDRSESRVLITRINERVDRLFSTSPVQTRSDPS